VSLLLVLSGIPILRWIGQRNGVRGTGGWICAGAMDLGALTLGVGFVGCAVAMAMYAQDGSPRPGFARYPP
jgi:hypothetical protein